MLPIAELFEISKTALSWLIPGFFATFAFESSIQNASTIRQWVVYLIIFFATFTFGLNIYARTRESRIEEKHYDNRRSELEAIEGMLLTILKKHLESLTPSKKSK
jgi:hypothetical protein